MKQKDFPKEMWIKDSCWQVRFVRNIDERGTLGLCDPAIKTIFIKQGQSYQERLDTYWHEVMHIFENEYGFSLNHKHVHKLGEAMARFYVENF